MATIRKRGNNYQGIVRRSGWPQQSASFPTKVKAERWCRAIETKMDKGSFTDQSSAKKTTLSDLMVIYLNEVTALRRREQSRQVERYIIKRILREEKALCGIALNKLKPAHFINYRDRRLLQCPKNQIATNDNPKTIAPSTVNRELSVLKCIVDNRIRKFGLPFNPVNGRDVKRLAVNDERDLRLTHAEIQRLLDAAYNMRNKLVGPFLELLFETGARRGELISLLWQDIDITKRTALFRDVKNTRDPNKILNRSIGLSPRAITILKQLPRDSLRAFPMTANAFKLSFQRARNNANLKHFRTHDARHERVSNLVEAGWPMLQVMAQSGHNDPKSLKRYTNLQANFLAEQLARLG